ncbi:hypothetical protein ACQ4LE_006191 [Meloidogyne hapla]
MKMRTPKQIEDWTFSVNGSEQTNDDTNKNITENSNITLVQEESLEEKCCAYECQLKNCQERIKVLEKNQTLNPLINLTKNCFKLLQQLFCCLVIVLLIVVCMNVYYTNANIYNQKTDKEIEKIIQIKFEEKIAKLEEINKSLAKEKEELIEQLNKLEQSKSSLENTVAQQKERLENIEEINKVDANQRVKELKRINELEKLKSLLNNIVAKQTEKIQNLEGQIIVVNDKRKELSERLNKAESELAELTNKLAKKVENSQENINSKENEKKNRNKLVVNIFKVIFVFIMEIVSFLFVLFLIDKFSPSEVSERMQDFLCLMAFLFFSIMIVISLEVFSPFFIEFCFLIANLIGLSILKVIFVFIVEVASFLFVLFLFDKFSPSKISEWMQDIICIMAFLFSSIMVVISLEVFFSSFIEFCFFIAKLLKLD